MKRITILIIIFSSAIIFCQSSIVFDFGTTIDVGGGADVCADALTVNGTYTGGGAFCGGALPVELVSFSANLSSESVILNWQTATEVNSYGFEIQRQNVGNGYAHSTATDWQIIGFVEGHGNSNSPKDYSFIDTDISVAGQNPQMGANGRNYRLKQIDIDGGFEYSDVVSVELEISKEFKLVQNFPNPFNPSTSINYSIPKNSFVTLKVYNTIGEEVAELINQNIEAGMHAAQFNASDLPTGAYFYRITAGNYSETKKMLLIR